MIFQRTKEFATQLDREDPLREYRTRFHIPHRDEKVVIYFYPKDNTPGCTKEACSIRDKYTSFNE